MATAYTWQTTTVPATSIPAPEIRSNDSITSPASTTFVTVSTPGGDGVRYCRGAMGRLFTLTADAGAVDAHRYDDTDAEIDSVELVASGGKLGAITARRSGMVDVTYADATGVRYVCSRDQGRSYSVAITVAAGYTLPTHWLDERDGMLVVLMYKESDTTWYVTVGELDSSGTTWTFSTPVTVVTSTKEAAAEVRRERRDGPFEFIYTTSAGAVAILRARALSKAGVGSWI
jgi:hypothetical protein